MVVALLAVLVITSDADKEVYCKETEHAHQGNPSISNADIWSGRSNIIVVIAAVLVIAVAVYFPIKHIFDRWGNSNRNNVENSNLETLDHSNSNSQQQVQIQIISATTLSNDGIYANFPQQAQIQMTSEVHERVAPNSVIDAPILIDASQVQVVPDGISDDLEADAPILIDASQVLVVPDSFPIPILGDTP